MKNNPESVHTPAELLRELQTLVGEAEHLMADSLSEHSSEAMENMRQRIGAVQARLSELVDGAKRRIVDGAKSTDAAIRANPYQSLAVALGAGVLLGLLLGRRTR
jgi:ElaB/YqjD/DUF883 family membrane-anchored ribosome-binding protein